MSFFQLTLVAISAVVLTQAIAHVYRFFAIYRRRHPKYLYLGLTAFGITGFEALQFALSFSSSPPTALLLHRVKLVAVVAIVYFYLNTIAVVASDNEFTGHRYLLPVFAPVLAVIPFDFVLSYPVRDIIVETPLGQIRTQVAQTRIGYTLLSLFFLTVFTVATSMVARSKALRHRYFYTTVMLLPVPIAINDFLVVHGAIRSVVLSNYYFFVLLFLVSFAFLREERENQEILETINADLDRRIRERTSELQEANARLEELASSDMLTGLGNRQRLMARLGEERARYQRFRREGRDPFSVVFIDLDNFKHYNDSFGHRVGDFLLQRFAELLRTTSRATDFVARFGGDEFVVVLPETTEAGAQVFAERLHAALKQRDYFAPELTSFLGGAVNVPPELAINCSVGIATHRANMDSEVLLANADRALYVAKAEGKHRWSVWTESQSRSRWATLAAKSKGLHEGESPG